jgi:predicted nucleic acid-binding protein
MKEYLLDSNILIYLLKNDSKTKALLKRLRREYFFISTISVTEVQWGARSQKDLKILKDFTRQFVPLDLRTAIAEQAVTLSKTQKSLKFKDLLIAATAQVEGLTLVTTDKDFKRIKDLKLKFFP